MSESTASIREWLLDQAPAGLAQAFEAMAGSRPETHLDAGAPPPPGTLARRQKFEGLDGGVWVAAAEADWMAAGNEVLRAAGIDDGDPPTVKSTFLETVGQALSSLASAITRRLGNEVTCGIASEASTPPATLSWHRLQLDFPSSRIALELAFEPVLIDQIAHQLAIKSAAEAPGELLPASGNVPSGGARTFDLLLDVELPVSVSFGRAQVPLKELIKLTTGSIVELNRSISEPVEVIVNNCVIARGEVVVVEGNFGVRIQQVVSRQERLRTLA